VKIIARGPLPAGRSGTWQVARRGGTVSVEGTHSQNLPVDEQCRSGTSGTAYFSTYLQTANPGGGALPAHQRAYPSEKVPTPEAARDTTLGQPASGVLTSERTFPVRRKAGLSRSRGRFGDGRVAWAFCGPLLVSSTGDAGCSENMPGMSKCSLSEPRLRMLLAEDSRTLVMKVATQTGVCNNSPA